MTLFNIKWSSLDEDQYLMEINATHEQVESFINDFIKEDGYIQDGNEFEEYLIEHNIEAERIYVDEIWIE